MWASVKTALFGELLFSPKNECNRAPSITYQGEGKWCEVKNIYLGKNHGLVHSPQQPLIIGDF